MDRPSWTPAEVFEAERWDEYLCDFGAGEYVWARYLEPVRVLEQRTARSPAIADGAPAGEARPTV